VVQNLLLLLTAHGMGTYWSSGAALRGPAMFGYLGIPERERLLGAIFIEYPDANDNDNDDDDDDTKQRVQGKLRDMRSGGVGAGGGTVGGLRFGRPLKRPPPGAAWRFGGMKLSSPCG